MVLAGFLLVITYVAVTLTPYLTAPGTDPVNARVVEWARDHGFSWAVTWMENETYQPPPTGGSLSPGQMAQLRGGTHTTPRPAAFTPAAVVPLASPPLAGEGQWHVLVTSSTGAPVVESTALRPDAVHTSALAYVAWMNGTALTFTLHPGFQQPGGAWQTPDQIPTSHPRLAATWNGGFKIADSLGGYYAEGRAASSLVDGKASEVFYRDGSLKIGQWGRDESMTPAVAAVRQNLSLLVDHGAVTVGPGDGSSAEWGYTIKNSYYIARSGVGMTARGDIVYVGGGELSVYTLAELLRQAGAVYAMELDINPDWVSFMTYAPQPAKLWDFSQPAERYLQPSSRDFVAAYLR